MRLRGALIAEFIGTFFLVFAGAGAIVVDSITHEVTHVGVSLVFGLVIGVLIYALGHISGAHFNPAVTISFWALGEFPARRVPWYVASQLLGAVAASELLRALFGMTGTLGVTRPQGAVTISLILEIVLTFLLAFVIFGSAVHGKAIKSFAGIAIGGTIALDALFGGPISGASMNPARSLGPALVSGIWADQWIYVVGPIAGALLAVVAYRLMTGDSNEGGP
ncbi:MAG TPA: MIP family channel protein [Candidatus Eremiobacteraceae bacterium]|nr:MIP family channel protein [Candidatus Eremiobacteraceae bacterium]